MSVVIKGKVSIKVYRLLKQKQLPGCWGVLYDGEVKDHKLPCIELYSDNNAVAPLHTLRLEHLKFSDKSYLQQEACFVVSIKKEKHFFEFDTMENKEDWVQSLCHVSPELWKQRASAREYSSFEDSDSSLSMSDNLLYDSYDKVQQFKVSVNPTKASEANKLQGYYMLSPTRDSLRLLDMISFKSIHEWPYRQIRKYGRTRNVFRMEVGRRCSTGEGEFEFFTPEGSALTELITMYTRQVWEQDTRRTQEGSLSPLVRAEHASRDHVENLTPSPPNSPFGLIPRRASENMKDTRDSDSGSQRMRQRSSASSISSGTRPIPAPRIKFVAAPNQENGSIRPTGKSSDMKIYETPSGLTAPLESKLKRELQSKLQVQMPDPEVVASRGHPAEANEDSPCSTPEPVADRHSAGGVFKDKKKSDKDKKKREKEEAKLRKQQEKEQKEREAKEQKEREKRLKKESKGHSKLQGKKTLDVQCPIPATVSASDGNIYDEPGVLVPVSTAAPPVADESAYAEADAVAKPQLDLYANAAVPHKPTGHQTKVKDVYATPEKPKKDSWKKHARDESEDIQQENYDSIKMASLAQSKSQPPPIPPQPQFCNHPPGADDVDDVYDRLRNFDRRTAAALAPENVYGMASAVETMRAHHPTPVPVVHGGNEYEETDTVSDVTRQAHAAQEVGSEYEDTAPLTPQHRPDPVNVNIPNDGDYADIS